MKLVLFIFMLASVCCSCSTIKRKLYSPTQINNPSLQEKNDYSLSLSYGRPSGFDCNGGYAVTNRIAVIGGLYSYSNRETEEAYSVFSDNKDSSILVYRHKGFHAGAGVFIPLEKNDPSLFAAFFAGLTKGSFRMNETFYEVAPVQNGPKLNIYKSDIDRWFVQGSINRYGKIVHHSIICRLNFVKYSNTDYNDWQKIAYNLPTAGYPAWSTFFDLCYEAKIFFSKQQRIGLVISSVSTYRINNRDYNFYIQPSRMNIGIVIKSPSKKQQKNSK